MFFTFVTNNLWFCTDRNSSRSLPKRLKGVSPIIKRVLIGDTFLMIGETPLMIGDTPLIIEDLFLIIDETPWVTSLQKIPISANPIHAIFISVNGLANQKWWSTSEFIQSKNAGHKFFILKTIHYLLLLNLDKWRSVSPKYLITLRKCGSLKKLTTSLTLFFNIISTFIVYFSSHDLAPHQHGFI